MSASVSVRTMRKLVALRSRLVERVECETLSCCCAISSYEVMKLLPKSTFVVGFFESEDHCWIERRGVIIDLTATQFDVGLPEVLVTKTSDRRYQKRIEGRAALDEIRDVWPISQQPTPLRRPKRVDRRLKRDRAGSRAQLRDSLS